MLNETGAIANEIKESLDIELITQQIKHNAFNPQNLTAYIISKMTQLCAPVRDQSIRNLSNMTDLASMFESCLEILDEMKLDLINYKLKSIAPKLKAQAVEYERSKFENAIDSGVVTLEKTHSWLNSAHQSLKQVADARNPENVLHPENRILMSDVYNEALMGLIFSSNPISMAIVPETLLLDASYLFKLQNDAQIVSITAALVMLSKNTFAELRRDKQASTALSTRLLVLLKGEDGEQVTVPILQQEILRICNLAINSVGPATDQSRNAQIPPEAERLLLTMIEKTVSSKDAVFNIINRRVQAVVRGQLNNGFFRAVTGGSLVSVGLDCVEKELMDLSKKVHALALHNKEVYSKWYDATLKIVIG